MLPTKSKQMKQFEMSAQRSNETFQRLYLSSNNGSSCGVCIPFLLNSSFLCFFSSELTSDLKVKPPGRSQIGKKKKILLHISLIVRPSCSAFETERHTHVYISRRQFIFATSSLNPQPTISVRLRPSLSFQPSHPPGDRSLSATLLHLLTHASFSSSPHLGARGSFRDKPHTQAQVFLFTHMCLFPNVLLVV